ncbi:MAG: cytochrome C oxidase subunit II [Bacteroidetes bacterium]|nr:MAG: cytochrome C oxidase subunit II [Bacteroidota bacterium]
MAESTEVIYGQTLAYTLYCIVIILVMAWFAYMVIKDGKGTFVKPVIFYTFVGFLTVLGVSLHVITYNTIPWAEMDLNRVNYTPEKIFVITVQDHKFTLPSDKMIVNLNDKVLFDVKSNDLTYGFGLFRSDNTMMFQMQVVPGHRNDILWHFTKPGIYTIRSTEYSGFKGVFMIEKDVVEVVDPSSIIK